MRIDITFNFRAEARGREAHDRDVDAYSKTLRDYHQILWSKQLPNGKVFELQPCKGSLLLYHESDLGQFYLSSDTIIRSYKIHQKSKGCILEQIPNDVQALYDAISVSVAAYIVFPSNQVNKQQTINGARGCNAKIDDRFDLTLECIRRFYAGQQSPLYQTLLRYQNFFALFHDFKGYANFFLLQDMVSQDYAQVRFFLPFDDFQTSAKAQLQTAENYLVYKNYAMEFLQLRLQRIDHMYNH